MKEKAITILREQIDKLDRKDFDLEAWKTQSIVLMGRIFGERSFKTEQIRSLHYDYSSWSLRDTRGVGSPVDIARKAARDLLEAAITELEHFGLPGETASAPLLAAIRESLEEHLKISAFRKLSGIMDADIPDDKKQEELRDLLRAEDPELPEKFFISLFSHHGMKGQLNSGK